MCTICLRARETAKADLRERDGSTVHVAELLGMGLRYALNRDRHGSRRPRTRNRVPNLALADARGVRQHGVEHRLQLARRTADDLAAPPRSRSAALAPRRARRVRCLHLVEQPYVLDGDHRLVGEGCDQLDLLVGERPHRRSRSDAITPIELPSRSSGTPSMVRSRRASAIRSNVLGISTESSWMWTIVTFQQRPADASNLGQVQAGCAR